MVPLKEKMSLTCPGQGLRIPPPPQDLSFCFSKERFTLPDNLEKGHMFLSPLYKHCKPPSNLCLANKWFICLWQKYKHCALNIGPFKICLDSLTCWSLVAPLENCCGRSPRGAELWIVVTESYQNWKVFSRPSYPISLWYREWREGKYFAQNHTASYG